MKAAQGGAGYGTVFFPFLQLQVQPWSQFTNHFKPTFNLVRREKKDGKTRRVCEATPKTPDQRLLESAEIPEATNVKLPDQHAKLDPFELTKNIEIKLKKHFTAPANLNREETKLQ